MLYNRLSYLIILLGTGLFFVCFDGYISYYVFLLSLALPLCSLLISLPGMLTMRVRVFLEDGEPLARTRKGQSLPLRVEARTPWPLPSGPVRLRLTVHNTLTGSRRQEGLLLTIGEKPLLLEHALHSAASGLVACTATKVRACDLLGLFSLPVALRGQNRCSAFFFPAVYAPALSVRPVRNPDSNGERYSQTKPGDDLSELFGLREYRPGDKVSHIHWKLSQKTGRTLVKEPSLPLADCLLFLLDLNGQGPEADVLLDVFATLSGFLLQEEVAHRVAYRSGQALAFLELGAPEDARPALEAILASGGQAALPPFQEEALPRGISHVLYLCCTPDPPRMELLRRHYPSARFTCFSTSGRAEAAGGPDVVPVYPGQVVEALNGMVL
ncbi:DUF58 domain-containing protein [bacterium D16-76]|nr:DUF58 domain-containing protein [bacterium D16-76]